MSASLASLLNRIPPLLTGEPVPMEIGAGARLRDYLAVPEGATKAEVHRLRRQLERALERYAATPAYLEALAAPGAMRFDLERNPIEPVRAEHAAWARAVLDGKEAPRAHSRRLPAKPDKITATIKVKSIKVAVVLPVETLLGVVLPPEGQPVGDVPLNLENDGGVRLGVRLNGKSVRKGQKTAREHGGLVHIVLQGKLGAANRILEAGLSVMPKLDRGDDAA